MAAIPYESAVGHIAAKVMSRFPLEPLYRVMKCRYPAGLDCDFHNIHDSWHVIATLDGRMVFQEKGGKELVCERGSVLTIPANCELRWKVEKDSVNIHYHHHGYELERHGALAYFSGPPQRIMATVDLEREQIETFERKLALAELSPCMDLALSVAGIELMLAAVETHLKALSGKNAREGATHDALTRCLNYVETNLDKRISLDDLARRARLSASRTTQIFREKLGISPQQYIAARRTELAKRLLSDGSLGVGEVAGKLGFNSLSYFSRFYKRRTGENPSNAGGDSTRPA